MRFFRKNILFRVFMVACAAAQMAAVMPHHHHESSDSPCINPLHCLEIHAHHGEDTESRPAGCCEDDCTGHLCLHNTCSHGHGHNEDGSDAGCSFGHLDLNPPVRDRMAFSPPVTELAHTFTTITDTAAESLCNEHGNAGPVVCCSVFSGTIALYTNICTSSIPARAPSFLA